MESDKIKLRNWAKAERITLFQKQSIEFVSAKLIEKLVQTEVYKNANNIMLFYPLKNEVNLLPLLKDSKQFYLPRIKNQELECCPFAIGDELCESCFHTKEPVCNACNKITLDMVIVPALACDKSNYRLGYGGGFYDRFLKDFQGTKVCCIPENFIVETVYPQSHDVKMDLLISA